MVVRQSSCRPGFAGHAARIANVCDEQAAGSPVEKHRQCCRSARISDLLGARFGLLLASSSLPHFQSWIQLCMKDGHDDSVTGRFRIASLIVWSIIAAMIYGVDA